MKFNSLVPELYVLDFEKSLEFYTQVLGFRVEYERDAPRFAFLSYRGSQLMIQLEEENEDWHNGTLEYPFGRGINFQIETDNVQQLVNKLKAINYPLKRGIKESCYKVKNTSYYCYKEFLVMDPDGYLLRFSQPVSIREI